MYYDFFEFRKVCPTCKEIKIAQNQSECLDCKARKIKVRNTINYLCKKSGGILKLNDFNMHKNKQGEL